MTTLEFDTDTMTTSKSWFADFQSASDNDVILAMDDLDDPD